jgi:V/A-type H+-transporting ATPase subunit I
MIVPMQKVAILVPEALRSKAVHRVGELGLLHLGPLRTLHDDSALADAERAWEILADYEGTGEQPADVPATLDAAARRRDAAARATELREEAARIAPLGDFDLATLAPLREAGLELRLYSRDETILACFGPDVPEDAIPFPMPEHSPAELRSQIAVADAAFAKAEAELAEFAKSKPVLSAEIARLREHQTFRQVLAETETCQPLTSLCGFCPEPRVAAVRQAIEALGGAVLAVEPDERDLPPTLLENATFAASAEPVYTLIDSLPGYREMDVSFWFLLYLALFVAILVGDAGYGLLLLVAAGGWHAWRGMSPPMLHLCGITGTLTMLWGALSGNWFGSSTLAQWPPLASLVLADLDVFDSASQPQVMYLCFVLGATQLAIAHIIAAWQARQAVIVLGHVGWLLMLAGAFFLVRFLVLDVAMPSWAMTSVATGTVLAVCFGQPRRGLARTLGAGLGHFPLQAIACFSDIISYIRLFAVGAATFAVAVSFNDIAAAMYDSGPLIAFVGLLVLVFGHAVNILMAGLAVVVHGVRLNMLEFSSHADLRWFGERYAPFRLHKPNTDP